ncbi:ABC-type Zn uptake system ZnuABC, Zn-binding component ZnuA [Pseudomonas sp. NFPP07]|uniref:metal ABC transporter solute-binding protein, Zn/Mn family n=1 Tax=Pseudomonas sp. NFPP07 TaxID=1566213 RepID=UPI0008E99B99|nr:zinc ABC transporter substrate-binding protein [Pseudomonas sp. NFPP07]SFP05915.1 ABC-type Zn uptake system ZnuABC, Zn-binding component ZnuA [Pseudomonas sp. NFPP07]
MHSSLRHLTRPLTLALALAGLGSAPALAQPDRFEPMRVTANQSLGTTALHSASSPKPLTVLASLPITFGLGQWLLQGTDVRLERAAPDNLPGSRQTAYFTGRGAPALHKLALDADAVIGLRSIWPDDPLYPNARRSNIRIVEVDAARPVDGALPGVALQPGKSDGLNSQPWLSSNNLGRMADVLAADLVRLAPAAKPKIDANLASLKQRLLKLSADSEGQLANADNLSVLSLSDHFGYLVSGLNLELLEVDARADNEWTAEALQQLQTRLKANDVAIVLHHRQPSAAIKAAIDAAGSQLLVLQTDSADPLAELENNIGQITSALAPKT